MAGFHEAFSIVMGPWDTEDSEEWDGRDRGNRKNSGVAIGQYIAYVIIFLLHWGDWTCQKIPIWWLFLILHDAFLLHDTFLDKGLWGRWLEQWCWCIIINLIYARNRASDFHFYKAVYKLYYIYLWWLELAVSIWSAMLRYAYAEYCVLDDLLGWGYARCSRWEMEGGTNGGRRRKRKGFPEEGGKGNFWVV